MARSASDFWPSLDETSASEERVWLSWLVRLRWVAIVAQLVTLSFASRILTTPWLTFPLLAVTAVLVLGNLRAIQVLHRDEKVQGGSLLLQLALDVLVLTAYFGLAGGPANPFTTLYLIHIAMAAVMMPTGSAAVLTVFILLCYVLIHFVHLPLDLDHHSFSASTLISLGHLVAMGITAGSIAVFVVGVAQTLRRRSRQLSEARERTAATDRLRAVGTLAAGAAHELNTPLSTMGLRLRRIGRRYADDDTQKDVEAIRGQLDRCAQIVERLLVGAGDPTASDIDRYDVHELVGETVKWWTRGSDTLVDLQEDVAPNTRIEVPRVAFTQALVNLLENAREAQDEAQVDAPVLVRTSRVNGTVNIAVIDRGVGLPEESEHRVGDPFFTTKASGTGLGVFVARAVADGSGGSLRYSDDNGVTEALWSFPVCAGGDSR